MDNLIIDRKSLVSIKPLHFDGQMKVRFARENKMNARRRSLKSR
jgi:hypothetical protein